MLSGTFITELTSSGSIEIPQEVTARLNLQEGDKVEVLVKKIKSGRMAIKISKNPLQKLLDIVQEQTKS
jgi:AbrB family looped-hinge helix DNA binding protein